MTGDNKCETCQNDKINCKCEATSSKPFNQLSIKPPDLFIIKEEESIALYNKGKGYKTTAKALNVPKSMVLSLSIVHKF